VLDSATGNATFVGGSNPVWSPDGRELAVLDPPAGNGNENLRIVDAASLSTRAAFPFEAIGGLAWSPNGQWIAATGGDGAKSIVRIDVVSGEVIQIEGPSGHLDAAREISWSPDSLRVAFVRYGNGSRLSLPRCGDILLCRVDVVVADADGARAVVVNLEPGQADLPSWSPDGKWLAYRATDAGPGADSLAGRGIQLVRADGTDARSLVVAAVGDFAWSRDSTSLLFIVDEGFSMATIWETSLAGEARSLGVSIDGGFRFERSGLGFASHVSALGAPVPPLPNPVLATQAPTLEVATPDPAVPADLTEAWPTLLGQRSDDYCAILRVATGTGLTSVAADLCSPAANESSTGLLSPSGDAYALIRDGRLTILPTNGLSGLDLVNLTGLESVAWSPDGMWLSVAGKPSYLLHPDGSSLHEIPGSASWSPDGRWMAVAMGDGSLLVGRSDGTGLHSIGEFPQPLTWAPDGSRFGFIRSGDFWTAAIDGSDVRNVTSFPFGGASDATWSPDGAWIAVTAGRGVWLMGPDGTSRRWLDPGLGQVTSGVAWSPDSSRVAVQAYEDGAAGQMPLIYLVSTDGSPTIRIDTAVYPSWSPDGRYLVANDVGVDGGWTAGSLAVMNADGSGRHNLRTTGVEGPLVWIRQ
jgi:Tol biopolymer transport system component